jgi:hypothetical protein
MMTKLGSALFLALAASACVDDPTLGGGALDLGPGSGNHEQGRYQLGSIADGLAPNATYYASAGTSSTVGTLSVLATGTAGNCLQVTNGQGTHTCTDPVFTGAVINGTGGSHPRFRVVDSATFTVPQDDGTMLPVTGYLLEHNASWPTVGAPSWQPYCVNNRVAFPLAGQLQRVDGRFVAAPGAITFACSEYNLNGNRPGALTGLTGHGVVAKAMSWGYLPGSDGTQIISQATIDGGSLHQGAVAAGRAAYCGDGVSHTLDATSIRIFDLVDGNRAYGILPLEPTPISQSVISSTSYSFESVWGYDLVSKPGGGTTERWHPICLSRLRWQTLPLGSHCGTSGVLLDPRTEGNKFCDDMSWYELVTAGALVGIYSQWNDLGLWRWRGSNGDYLTTSTGSFGGSELDIEPAPGFAGSPAELQGTLLTSTGKDIFEANFGSNAGTLVEVLSCPTSGGADWVTGRRAWLANQGFLSAGCKSEGYTWTALPAGSVRTELGWTMAELKVWSNAGEYATSVVAPNGYTFVTSAGWIVEPAGW